MKRPGLSACRDCGALSLGLASCPRCASRVVLELPEPRESLSTQLAKLIVLLVALYGGWEFVRAPLSPEPRASAEARAMFEAREGGR